MRTLYGPAVGPCLRVFVCFCRSWRSYFFAGGGSGDRTQPCPSRHRCRSPAEPRPQSAPDRFRRFLLADLRRPQLAGQLERVAEHRRHDRPAGRPHPERVGNLEGSPSRSSRTTERRQRPGGSTTGTCRRSAGPYRPHGNKVLPHLAKKPDVPVFLDPAFPAPVPLLHQNGQFARFLISLNKSMFDYIVSNVLYNKEGQQRSPMRAKRSASPAPVPPTLAPHGQGRLEGPWQGRR